VQAPAPMSSFGLEPNFITTEQSSVARSYSATQGEVSESSTCFSLAGYSTIPSSFEQDDYHTQSESESVADKMTSSRSKSAPALSVSRSTPVLPSLTTSQSELRKRLEEILAKRRQQELVVSQALFFTCSSGPGAENFGGKIPMKQRRSLEALPSGTNAVKVLSDEDDSVTLAILRADDRQRVELKRLKEHRKKFEGKLPERDYIVSKYLADTGIKLPPPTIRKGFRAEIDLRRVAVDATLAIHHIQNEVGVLKPLAEELLGSNVIGAIPHLKNIKSVREKRKVYDQVVKHLKGVEEMVGKSQPLARVDNIIGNTRELN
jgi:hypothetical protein